MSRAAIPVLLIAAVALSGCMSDFTGLGGKALNGEVGGPGFHVRESDFYWSYGTWGETHEDRYTWNNPEGEAHVEARWELSQGDVHVKVLDANSTTVWSHTFSQGDGHEQFRTGSGEPGEWTVVIQRQQAEGPFDLHAWRAVDG